MSCHIQRRIGKVFKHLFHAKTKMVGIEIMEQVVKISTFKNGPVLDLLPLPRKISPRELCILYQKGGWISSCKIAGSNSASKCWIAAALGILSAAIMFISIDN